MNNQNVNQFHLRPVIEYGNNMDRAAQFAEATYANLALQADYLIATHETNKEQNSLILNEVKKGKRETIDAVTAVGKEFARANRKPKAVRGDQEMMIGADGKLYYLQGYDDGKQHAFPFVTDALHHVCVKKIRYLDDDNAVVEEFLLIDFNNGNFTLLKKHSKAAHIYEMFVESGVAMTNQLSAKRKTEVLYVFISKLWKEVRETIELPQYAGWYGDFYMNSLGLLCDKEVFGMDLPILERSLAKEELSINELDKYLATFKKINAVESRLLFLLSPVIGIMNTLLDKSGVKFPYAINVALGVADGQVAAIANYFSIFMEKRLFNLSSTEKQMKKQLVRMKDEVFLCYFPDDCEKTKKQANLKFLGNLGHTGFLDKGNGYKKWNNVSLIFSKFPLSMENVLHLYLTEEATWMAECLERDSACRYYKSIISFTENNMSSVLEIVAKEKGKYDIPGADALSSAYKILEMYVASSGISLKQVLKLPDKLDFDVLINKTKGKTSSDIDFCTKIFLNYLYGDAKNRVFGQNDHSTLYLTDVEVKEISSYEHHLIYYCTVFDGILTSAGVKDYKNDIYSNLVKKGILIPGGTSFAYRRRTRRGPRQSYYRLNRQKLFEYMGEDIVVMGQERRRNERLF